MSRFVSTPLHSCRMAPFLFAPSFVSHRQTPLMCCLTPRDPVAGSGAEHFDVSPELIRMEPGEAVDVMVSFQSPCGEDAEDAGSFHGRHGLGEPAEALLHIHRSSGASSTLQLRGFTVCRPVLEFSHEELVWRVVESDRRKGKLGRVKFAEDTTEIQALRLRNVGDACTIDVRCEGFASWNPFTLSTSTPPDLT